MSTVLAQEHPDFVVYLGDIITPNNIPIKYASLYWDQAISPTRERGIPWASVFGNHDDMYFEWPMEWFSSTGIPPLHCQVNVSRPPESEGGGSYPEVISNAQAEWFNRTSQEINPNSRVPEIMFWHIPNQAYKEVGPRSDAHGNFVGSLFMEEVAVQGAEMGMMELLEGRYSVKTVFVGHNHGLDWCCPYKKLWLCYARHSGYGRYGNWPRGARILEITQQPFSLKSWIRMEDGHAHSEVLFSS